jgi:outer membrane protein insertion porin family
MSRAVKTVLICLALGIALTAGAAAQDAESDWYLNKPIKEFTFSGLVTVKEGDLQAVLKPYIGEKYTSDLLIEIQAKLYALDYFESLVASAAPGDDARSTLIIQFAAKERPSVVAIEVSGNASVHTNEITDKILIKKGDLSNQSRLLADVEAVKSLYLDKGYTDANVTATFVPGDKDTTVKAVFTIAEGTPTTIKEIDFSGNVYASANTLRGVMKTKAQFLFDSGVFQESKLEEDKAAIVAYYTNSGFVDAKVENVTRTLQTDQGRNYLVLTIYIAEGEQWTYAGMSFSGNSVFDTARLTDLVTQKKGKNLSLQKVQADVNRVRGLYYDSGFIFNSFTTSETRDAAAKTIAYTLTIVEADKAHIENIIFRGNTRTKEYVLRRGLPFEEGDIFNRDRIVQGIQYLQNLQFFKTVVPDTPAGSEPGLMNVVFTLEETSTADINFGVVFSGGDFPVSGTIKWNERNFQGKGQTLGIDLEASLFKQTVGFNFLEPWLTGVPWSAGISLSFDHSLMQNVLQDSAAPIFASNQDANAYPDGPPEITSQALYLAYLAAGNSIPAQYLMSYDSYNITFNANTGYTFTLPFGRLGLQAIYSPQLRYVNYNEMIYRPFDKNVRDNNHTWNFIDRLAFTTALDGRDIFWNPTKGYLLSQGLTLVGGFLFGNRDYVRTDTTAEGFLTLFDLPVFDNWNWQMVLAAHSSLSLIMPNWSFIHGRLETNTDSSDQLYIDGMTVGRSWRQAQYGNALWDNKLELRMPLAKDAIWLVGFFDAAALWDKPFASLPQSGTSMDQITVDDFLFSLGFGVRFTIPQFPIRLYLAKGFQYQPALHPGAPLQWHAGDAGLGGLNFVISLGGNVF